MLGVTDLAPDLWISANIPPSLDQVNSFCRVLAMSQQYGCGRSKDQGMMVFMKASFGFLLSKKEEEKALSINSTLLLPDMSEKKNHAMTAVDRDSHYC